MYREYVRWGSPSLGRDMEFLWFGQFGRPVVLFTPTSRGGWVVQALHQRRAACRRLRA